MSMEFRFYYISPHKKIHVFASALAYEAIAKRKNHHLLGGFLEKLKSICRSRSFLWSGGHAKQVIFLCGFRCLYILTLHMTHDLECINKYILL